MNDFKPTIVTDGGPWAEHNMPCAIYDQSEKAVLNLNKNVFEPSWKAQQNGWHLIKVKNKFQNFVLKLLKLI